MYISRTLRAFAFAVLVPVIVAVGGDLRSYVERPEPDFQWSRAGETTRDGARVYQIRFTSQRWQGTLWEHELDVIVPPGADLGNGTVLLVLLPKRDFGGASGTMAIIRRVAEQIDIPIALLHDIPNQPLFGGLYEDELVADTLARALETRDETWPILLPMTKSAVKGMDVIQAFGREMGVEVRDFILTGRSKRGSTSWLAAAVDRRVRAIAPQAIDYIHFAEQDRRQVETYGPRRSPKLKPYLERELFPFPDTPESKHIMGMIDPYTYRDALTIPKLILAGTNDPFWTVDALNGYYEALVGEKPILYVPNAGHALSEKGPNGPNRAAATLAAFVHAQTGGPPLPKLDWKMTDDRSTTSMKVRSDREPTAALLWVAASPTLDFRRAKWRSQRLEISDASAAATVRHPDSGYKAFYAELAYEDGHPFTLTTPIRVTGAGQ